MGEIHYTDLETSGKRILCQLQDSDKAQWFINTPVVTMLCANGLITIKRTTAKKALCEITSTGMDCYENRNIPQPVVASEPAARLGSAANPHILELNDGSVVLDGRDYEKELTALRAELEAARAANVTLVAGNRLLKRNFEEVYHITSEEGCEACIDIRNLIKTIK